jgi:hypothetical protein
MVDSVHRRSRKDRNLIYAAVRDAQSMSGYGACVACSLFLP